MNVKDEEIETAIVEDDLDTRTWIEEKLREYEIGNYFLFADSTSFLLYLNPKTKILVVDFRLDEGRTGMDVMREARANNPSIYVIVISGHVSEDVVIDFLNAKADWFIKKTRPDFFDALAVAILEGKAIVKKRDAIVNEILKPVERITEKEKRRKQNDTGAD